MLTAADLQRKKRQIYLLSGAFALLSASLCAGSYFGWFGWFLWGRPKREPAPVVAEGSEAREFALRLIATEARYAREDIRKLREMLDLMDKVRDARYEKYAAATRAPEPLSSLSVAEPLPEEQAAVTCDVERQGFTEIYGTARRLDKRLHDVYRVFRACELARLQYLTLQKAYQVTDVVAPEHPDLDPEALVAGITSTADEAMMRFRDELAAVKTEIRTMVGAGRRMLDLAAILEPGILATWSEWDFANQAGRMYNIQALIERPDSLFEGETGMDPRAFEHEWGRGEGPITKKELGLPVELGIDLSKAMPLAGRKLMQRGAKAKWMFVNMWYVIGPFPNPGRRNLEEKFPPEASLDPTLGFTGIDLDARYVGMDQKPVRWEFLATDRRVCFIPYPPEEWAIWYAYTEIWCDEEQNRFCIFGSDDYGKCWVNGEEVFTSGKTPHPWVPDRKHANVRLRKGVNTVLFKLENAWGRTGFSMCIYAGRRARPDE